MDRLLTVKEVAEILRVSKSTIYRYCWRGLLPHEKVGCNNRIRQCDVEAFLDRGMRKAVLIDKILKKILTSPFQNHIDKAKGANMAGCVKSRRRFAYGSVYQRKPGGSWTIDYRDRNGRRIQEVVPHAQTREEADFALRKKVAKLFDGKYGIERRREKIGFKTFAQSFLEDYMMTARRNFKSDVYRLNKLCDHFKDTDLRVITTLTVERLRKERRKVGNTKSTCNRYLALVKRMFNVAIEEGYAEENPVTKVKLFTERDTLKEWILTGEEEERLYEASAGYLKPILDVACNTGMRKAEILNLQRSQVDFKKRTIRVEKTKSGKVRYIPMNDTLFNELNTLMRMNGQSPFVFFNPETRKPWHDLKRQFRNACRKAEVEGLRFHDLRHTFATRLAERGIDVETIRDILGHASITTTQRYMHSNDERKRKAVRLLERKRPSGDNLVTKEIESNLIH